MSDLISRQAAIDEAYDVVVDGEVFKVVQVETLLALPSAQPECKTGRWETAMLDHEAFGVRPKVLYCSECNQCIAYPTRYCPNCGAKMDGEVKSNE